MGVRISLKSPEKTAINSYLLEKNKKVKKLLRKGLQKQKRVLYLIHKWIQGEC